MDTPKNTPNQPYRHFKPLLLLSDTIQGYTCKDGDGYLTLIIAPEGIMVQAKDYANLSKEVMRETVEVMRELVARFDALEGGTS